MSRNIVIKGAKVNNLKDVDVTIPRDKLVSFFDFSGFAFLPISIISATFLRTLSGVMPCSSLYFICIARRRLVSSIAARIEPVILSAYIIT